MNTKAAFLAWAASRGYDVTEYVAEAEEHEDTPFEDPDLGTRISDFQAYQLVFGKHITP